MQSEAVTTYQNKEIHVVLEFPEQSDPKAESEFIGRLKEIFLRKIEIGAMQKKDSALESNPIVNAIGMSHKPLCSGGNTKEDKKHE